MKNDPTLRILETPSVDPWLRQNRLMDISDQPRPPVLCLTPDSVLYLALKMEEFSETLEAFTLAFNRAHDYAPVTTLEPLQDVKQMMANAAWYIAGTGLQGALLEASKRLRTSVANLPEGAKQLRVPLELKFAQPIADGLTDEMVVTAGLAAACGLPGAACYDEVSGSNLSKANPDTGKIHKDPSGKWIKGENYREPDLARVLASHESENVRYYRD